MTLTGDLAWLARELATLRATPGRNATRFDLETLTTIFAFVDSKLTWQWLNAVWKGAWASTNAIDRKVCV